MRIAYTKIRHNSNGIMRNKKWVVSGMKKFSLVLMIVLLAPAAVAQSIVGSWGMFSSTGFTPRGALTTCEVAGKIYAIGGFNGTQYITTVEVYDPAIDTWDSLSTTGTFTPRRGVSSVVIGGKIYVFGGANEAGALNTLEVLDPIAKTWTTPATTGTFSPRWRSSAKLVGSKVYVLGGFNNANGILDTVNVFDTLTKEWSTPVTLGTFAARSDFSAEVIDGKIYVVGGQGDSDLPSPQVYDPATSEWSTPVTSGSYAQRQGVATAQIEGKIYAFGGKNLATGKYFNSIDVYDPQTNSWINPSVTGNPIARAGSCATMVNGKVYIMGGRDVFNLLDTNEVFTPAVSGVSPSSISGQISCFPNPTNDKVTIQGTFENSIHVTVTDILGQILLDKSLIFGSQNVTLDLSALLPGVYSLHVNSAADSFEKMVVKR